MMSSHLSERSHSWEWLRAQLIAAINYSGSNLCLESRQKMCYIWTRRSDALVVPSAWKRRRIFFFPPRRRYHPSSVLTQQKANIGRKWRRWKEMWKHPADVIKSYLFKYCCCLSRGWFFFLSVIGLCRNSLLIHYLEKQTTERRVKIAHFSADCCVFS